MRTRLLFVTALCAIGALAVPAVSSAATKSVGLGLGPQDSKRFGDRYQAESNNYYPGRLTIHRGDSVRFVPYGFHDVNLQRGSRAPALLVPSGTVSGATDAAGASFWFNGQPAFGFNSAVLNSKFGKKATYTGAKTVRSGLPIQARPKPFVVRFPKAGTFRYLCSIHPGMKGTISVKSRRTRVPSVAADRRTIRREVAKDETAAKKLLTVQPAANTVDLGEASTAGIERFAMVPESLTVSPGTTVTFQMPVKSIETHTATFGPGDAEKPGTYLGDIAKTFEGPGPFDGRATYPSEPPPSVATLTSSLHGNGFWNSGVMDRSSASPLPASSKLTFGQAGSYKFYCLIHPFMVGTVTVK